MKRRRVSPRLSEFDLDLILATQTAEREAQTEYERNSLHPAFRRGYDSDRWPFDIKRAIASVGYRKGIENASRNTWFNPQWRSAAVWELNRIVYPILQAYDRKERRQRFIASMMQYYYE